MEKELLQLKPKRFLCPYCGEWHEWEGLHTLEWYDSEGYMMCHSCKIDRDNCYKIYFYNDYCYYSTSSPCNRAGFNTNGKIAIASIIESEDKPTVTFKVPFYTRNAVSTESCKDCIAFRRCNLAKLGEIGDGHNMEITLGFEFEQSAYDRLAKSAILARKERNLNAKSELLDGREEALEAREKKIQGKEQSLQAQESAIKGREEAVQARESALDEREDALNVKEEEINQIKIEEERKMAEEAKKGTSIKTLLYERSPKENMEMVKTWAEKYKPVLKWAVPVAAVYGAYRILNSDEFDLSVNNVAETCEKKLGFRMECLENKKALKELMVLGGLSAGAYGAVQALSGLLGANNEEKEISPDISVEEVETGMNQLQSISKRFSWLQPKTENMLPIALSVIMVYATLHKPKFTGKFANKVQVLTEDIQIKVGLYLDLAKDFIQDKFNIDLSNEEEQRKLKVCAFLLVLMGILAFLYGKKVLGDKSAPEADGEKKKEEINKSVEAFVAQAKTVVENLAPAIYTYLITLFTSKKILMLEEAEKTLEEEGSNEVVVEAVEEPQGKPTEGPAEPTEPETPTEQNA